MVMSDDFPLLRASLAPAYAGLDPNQLDHIVRTIYGPRASAEDVEGFFDDLGHGFQHAGQAIGGFAQKAAPVVAGALPSIAQGAMAGSAFGPYGMLIGGLAGAASGILQQSSNPTARGIGSAIHNVGSLVSTVRGGGAGGALGSLASVGTGALGGGSNAGTANAVFGSSGGGGASNALMGMLARPETMQALTAGAMGSYGRQSVSVGGQEVPIQVFLSALGTLTGRAAHEAAELDETSAESVPAYLAAAGESLGIDTDDAEGRTDALLTLLALSPSIWASQASTQRPVTVNVTPTDPPTTEWIWSSENEEDLEADEEWPEWEEGAWDEGSWDEAAWDEEEAINA
jgi:hypothetical protein